MKEDKQTIVTSIKVNKLIPDSFKCISCGYEFDKKQIKSYIEIESKIKCICKECTEKFVNQNFNFINCNGNIEMIFKLGNS